MTDGALGTAATEVDEIPVGTLADFEDGARRLVRTKDRVIVVLCAPSGLRAYENRCAHQGGPVGQGRIVGRTRATVNADRTLGIERFSEDELHLVCPWHGWEFDVNTGRCAADPRAGLRRYEVVVRGDEVFVRV